MLTLLDMAQLIASSGAVKQTSEALV